MTWIKAHKSFVFLFFLTIALAVSLTFVFAQPNIIPTIDHATLLDIPPITP